MTFSIDQMKERNRSLSMAGDGITKARETLDRLERVLLDTVHGQFPDLNRVVDLAHDLSKAHDDILIGMVESSALPTREGFR